MTIQRRPSRSSPVGLWRMFETFWPPLHYIYKGRACWLPLFPMMATSRNNRRLVAGGKIATTGMVITIGGQEGVNPGPQ